jgi:hypothetical protein
MTEPNDNATSHDGLLVPRTIPSTPDPALMTLVESAVRSILLLLSGLGVYHGVASDSLVFLISSAVIAIGTALWGIYAKYRDKRADHAGNVLSARLQKPVQPE